MTIAAIVCWRCIVQPATLAVFVVLDRPGNLPKSLMGAIWAPFRALYAPLWAKSST